MTMTKKEMLTKAYKLEQSALRKKKQIEDLNRKKKRLERKKRFHKQSVRPNRAKSEKNIRRLPYIKPSTDKPIKTPQIEGVPIVEKSAILCVVSHKNLETIGGIHSNKEVYRRLGEKTVIQNLSKRIKK